MANPLISMLGLGNNAPQPQQPQQNGGDGFMANLNTVLGLYNSVKQSLNPVEAINQMAQTNKDVADTIRYINSNGGDLTSIADDLSRKNGVSLQLLMNLFK